MSKLTHVDTQGNANMVDVEAKMATTRIATAEGFIYVNAATLDEIIHHQNKKGDVITTAKIAGIMAAKQCSNLIPLCHPLMLSKVDVGIDIEPENSRLRVTSMCKLSGKTGVEMEALTAVNVALLTLFDMCKASDPAMRMEGIRVLSKTGGKTGDWTHPNESDAK
ncbi:cyclic pyranopterin monophosphate synthase MoaC [Agaribacter marinus]|uniref:Cyclic pyranopterin monophosphate synthase n=1 Tax=Agaribacter marinus TaxID=1431249 RepID=A0AA37SV74_9ALTE|nr:cyclic pyranopterin monophosphate synthase MoaC [Agaribacter marinus]GLR69374.1 cyclic pyranopterin monophosphate synthase accessory protein [Agaribacter marinus]